MKKKMLEEQVSEYRLEIENIGKKYQELYGKYGKMLQDRENDIVCIDRMKEDLVRTKTSVQILMNERDVISRINEELSVSNHIKDTQIADLKAIVRPSADYKFAVEMNVMLEKKLKTYENTLAALHLQLKNKSYDYKYDISRYSKKTTAAQTLENSPERPLLAPSSEEIQYFIDDFNELLIKYQKCKNKKHEYMKSNSRLNEKILILTSQTQKDHNLIVQLQNRAKTPLLELQSTKKKSTSQFNLAQKRRSLDYYPKP